MRAVTELILVLACASLGAVATWKIAGPPERLAPGEIYLATVQAEWPAGSFLWIDARTEAEWKRNGVPGSIHLTTTGDVAFDVQVEASLEQLATAPRAVVYCGSAGCGISKEVVKRLEDLALIPEVRALHGGWEALKEAGLVTDSSPAN